MKKFGFFGMLLAFAAGFTACEEANLEFDVPFDQVVERTYEIPASADTVIVLTIDSIDASIEADLEENLDKLKELKVEGVEVNIKSITPNQDLNQVGAQAVVTLLAGSVDGQEIFQVAPFGTGFVTLEDLVLENPKTITDFPINNINAALNMLKSNGKLFAKLDFKGVNQTGNDYTVDVAFKLKFKGKIGTGDGDNSDNNNNNSGNNPQ
ncbi:hypothetical protein [Luteibaculum oceani]|uniref:DUF4840 domain-containing protein n=1 Tax=Luteibaculum oceani TaxID=1294296 RepID=A0A5C6VDM5_9FLAO|nr:hypothetical protein [Luteibaculum oceani]TXC81815.1 hypothetical protein FRX97_04665 [Luteibaculum oceani]